MNKDSYWFKHDSNASQDLKLKALRKRYGWQGAGWYWYLIETLRNETDYKLEYSDFTFESLAEDMKVETEQVKKFIDDCVKFHLFTAEDSHFSSDRLLRDMAFLDDKREKARSAGIISGEHRKAATEPIDSDFEQYVEEMRTTYPHLDIDAELVKYRKWWSKEGKGKGPAKRPKQALKHWLDKAGKPYKPATTTPTLKPVSSPARTFTESHKMLTDAEGREYYIDPSSGMRIY